MEIRTLRSFVVVAEEENLLRAGLRLNTTQSTLSRLVKSLEEELGTDLFERLGRRIRLTGAGKVFLDEARKLIAAEEIIKEKTRQAAVGQLGRLTVCLNIVNVRQSTILNSIRQFHSKYPDVLLSLQQLNTYQQIEGLQSSAIDAGYVSSMFAKPPDYDSFLIGKHDFILAVPKFHRLASARRVVLRDLVDEPFIWFDRSYHALAHDRLIDECRRGGLVPRIAQFVSAWPLALDLVSAGIGIMFVTDTVKGHHDGVHFKKVADFSIPCRFELMWRRDNPSPVLKLFVQAVTALY